MDNLGWTQVDKDRFRTDLETVDESVLKRFDDGEFDLDASKVLDGNKILRRQIANQASLTKIKNKLPAGITMDDVKGLIANSDSKKVLLDQLSSAIDDIDPNTFKSMFDGKVFYNKVATLNLLETIANPPILNTTQALIDNQKQLRTAIDELKSTGQQYSTEYNTLMKQVNDARERITEEVSDAYFAAKNATEVKFTWPNSPKQGNFDRVYKNIDGTWSIVECKGGSSGLKGRKDANGDFNQQGTKEYIQSVINDLIPNVNLTGEQKRLLNELNDALNDPQGLKVTSYVLRQPYNDLYDLSPTKLSKVQL